MILIAQQACRQPRRTGLQSAARSERLLMKFHQHVKKSTSLDRGIANRPQTLAQTTEQASDKFGQTVDIAAGQFWLGTP